MRERHRLATLRWVLVVLLVLLAIADARPGLAQQRPVQVRIGYHPAMCLAGIYIAKDNGTFARAGLAVEIIRYEAGPAMIPAFINEEIDVAFLGAPPAISAMDRGVDISIYGMSHVEGSAMIVGKDSPYRKVGDLRGKVIAVPAYGSIQDVLTRMILKEHGLDPKRDVRLMEAGELGGVAQLPVLLKRGHVDAFVAWPPINETALMEGFGRVLVPPSEMVKDNPCCVIAARNAFVTRHPDIFKTVLRVATDTSVFARAYPKEAARSISNVAGFKPEVAEYSLSFCPIYDTKPSVGTIDATMRMLRAMKELGYIKQDLPKERVFNLKFIEEVHPEPGLGHYPIGPRPDIYKKVTGREP